MDRSSLAQELIATAAPVFISKALQYLKEGRSPTQDEIVAEVLKECRVVNEGRAESSADKQYAGPYGYLVDTLADIIDEITEDVTSRIKTELRMEIHVQLSEFKSEFVGMSKSGNDYSGSQSEAPIGGLMQFEITDDTKIEGVKSGYDSIKEYNALENNPLFKMVSKSVNRAASGQSSHSAEEYNAARANRTDADASSAILNVEKKINEDLQKPMPESEPEDSKNDMWDKMFAEKYGGL